MQTLKLEKKVWLAIIVSALGYFVDVYDLVVFNVVRIQSLKSLNIPAQELTSTGLSLLNIQLIGLLVGGLLWGVLGDKKGRIKVLFASIFLYSCSNIANAFVDSIPAYGICRFLTGIGLGGEFGVGVTLVSELMPKEKRGYGTMFVAIAGIFGAVSSSLIGDLLPWRTAYIVAGVLGLGLLGLRIGIHESKIFEGIKKYSVPRGSLLLLFKNGVILRKYLMCVAIGTPIWIIIGLFMTLAPELGQWMHTSAPVTAGRSILFFNFGFGSGELLSSLISQILKSRKKSILIFLILNTSFAYTFLSLKDISDTLFYLLCYLLGLGSGYWAVFMMTSAEQFGTNLRATVTTSSPNLVRAWVVPSTFALGFLNTQFSLATSLGLIFGFFSVFSFLSVFYIKDTFSRDLDFVETA